MSDEPELVKVGGLWVPAQEVVRFENLPLVKGLPDIDLTKMNNAIRYTAKSLAALGKAPPRYRRALDVGAHIGAVSLYLARFFDRVDAFEAIPYTYKVLERNTAASDKIFAHNLAIAETAKQMYFEFVALHSQITHAVQEGESRFWEGKDESNAEISDMVGPIEARPIDSFDYDDVDMIKIDVEGSELQVLEGARETLLRCKPAVLMEQNGNEERFHGAPRNEASGFIESLGMQAIEVFGMRHRKDRLFIWV